MPHPLTCDKCGLSEREIEIGTMTSALGNLIAVCPTCAQFERNKIRGDADLGKRVEELLADRMALRKRVDVMDEGLRAIRYTLQNEAVLSTDAGTKIVITHLINICTETLEGK